MRQTLQRTKMSKPTKSRMIGNRFGVVIFVLAIWFCGIAARLVYLQTVQADWLRAKANSQQQRERKNKPLRGSILDRNGRELAIALEANSLWVDPTEINNIEATSYQLAKLINEKPKELLTRITDARNAKKRYLVLAQELKSETVDRIKTANIEGLRWVKEQNRSYPHGSLAAQTIGFTNREDIGQAGIEQSQDKNLRGEIIETIEEKDGAGKTYEIKANVVQAPRNVRLTIDQTIQFQVEQALENGLINAKAKSGTAIVIQPQTGEILAMATAPGFNLNKVNETAPDLLNNRIVQNIYEPGSTFKLVTYSAALEEGLAHPGDAIDKSSVQIGTRKIEDPNPRNFANLADALAVSSNLAATKLGQKVGKDKLYEYIKRFGYGEATGIELPAETRGRVFSPEKWTSGSLASIPIGYEIGANTLQTAAAYSAIANNGVRIAPHLVKDVQESDGTIFAKTNAESRRVVSEKTAKQMRQILQAVVERGTGKLARLNGYTAGGKTGTANKYDPAKKSYGEHKVVASFVGFAPVENPAVVIAVMIDEPNAKANHGGDVAAPVFREIAEQILPAMHVAPDAAIRQNEEITESVDDEKPSNVPQKNDADEQKTDAKSLKSPKVDDKKITNANVSNNKNSNRDDDTIEKTEKVKVDKPSVDKKITAKDGATNKNAVNDKPKIIEKVEKVEKPKVVKTETPTKKDATKKDVVTKGKT
ncbi:MAG: penicillin-binding protein 2 [Pyrinomonadaceae bacterium]|nr:penicillin-binding protein 2 [Pyrinomonadaceae bacterium]